MISSAIITIGSRLFDIQPFTFRKCCIQLFFSSTVYNIHSHHFKKMKRYIYLKFKHNSFLLKFTKYK